MIFSYYFACTLQFLCLIHLFKYSQNDGHKNRVLIQDLQMSNTPFTETMYFTDFYKKVKRLRLFEPSVGILGLAVCVILFFFFLDYRTVGKGLNQNERFLWMRSSNESRNRVDIVSEKNEECDVFDGYWVWDESYPLYHSKDCRFLDQGFKCKENGRPDFFYTKWRWQPKKCNLPRFEAKLMLEKLRNRRVVFVGDSIGRNQWESLLCMLSSAVPDKDSIYEVNGNPITKHKGFLMFKFVQYNCTIEYYRAPFLVLQSRPLAKIQSKVKTTLKLDQMDWTSDKWREADVIIFNTGHWWNYEKTIRAGCYFQEGFEVKMDMRVDSAYKRSLQTVIEWIHREVNTTKQHVFFRTYAPVHFRGGDWHSGGTCHLETLPELGSSSIVPIDTWTKYTILAQVINPPSNTSNSEGGFDVLNVTHMTSRRKDGHSSLYYLGQEARAPLHRQDCSHWCLPGVPDTWNELLYALFMKRELIKTSDSLNFHAQV